MEDDAPRLSIILPAYNEARRLVELATRLQVAVDAGALSDRATEVIVVDDGSDDETASRAEELLSDTFHRLLVLRQPDNRGKGAAIRLGVAAASAPITLFMDADMSVDPMEIPVLVERIGAADLAMGSRSVEGSIVETYGIQRKAMGWTFNAVVTSVTGLPYRDTQCGFKAFRTPVARMLFHLMRIDRFAFDVEVLYLAHQMQMDIAEVPVHWREMRESKVRKLSDPFTMTRDVLNVRRRGERPCIPALEVGLTAGDQSLAPGTMVARLRAVLGPQFPILVAPEDRLVVLLPLSEPMEVQEVAAGLRRVPGKCSVREHSLSLGQLRELAPFRWFDAGSGEVLVASATETTALTATVPGGSPSTETSTDADARFPTRHRPGS